MATSTSSPAPSASSNASSSQNFQNNLFTDFAPLLTLFGEEITKQFLSTSMGWADNVLLGIAPLGITTVVICAIRIGGNRFLKSFIGRARDSPDDEEKEILSSTSLTVREIWNEQQVIRQSGEPVTVDIIHQSLEKVEDEGGEGEVLVDVMGEGEALVKKERKTEDGNNQGWESEEIGGQQQKDQQARDPRALATDTDGDNCPVYPVSYTLSKGFYFAKSKDPGIWGSTTGDIELQNLAAPDSKTDELVKVLQTTAPNLTLNIPKAIPPRWKVRTFAVIGGFVQVFVLSFNAAAVYYWRWSRDGKLVASYGYPTWVAGTVCMSFGISLCARVVQLSTVVHTLAPSEKEKSRFQVVRLQNKIPDLNRPAYAIYNFDPSIRISIRAWPPVVGKNSTKAFHDRTTKALGRKLLRLTVTGTSLTIAGFICQNIGTRELHWSAGVFQLGATLFLAALRAWLRRYVGDAPPSELELEDDFEACDLACSLERYSCGIVLQPLTIAPSDFGCSEELPVAESSQLIADVGRSTLATAKGRVFSLHASRIINAQVMLTSFTPNSDYIMETASSVVQATLEILGVINFQSSFFWNAHLAVSDFSSLAYKSKAIVSIQIGLKKTEGQIKIRERMESCQKIAAILGLTIRHWFMFMQDRVGTQQREFKPAEDHTPPRDTMSRFVRIIGCCSTASSDNARKRFLQWIGPVALLDRSPTGEIIAIGDDLGLCTERSELRAISGYPYSAIFPIVDLDTTLRSDIIAVSSNMNLMQFMALDLISSFMLQFASAEKIRIEKHLKTSGTGWSSPVGDIIRDRVNRNSFCDGLAKVLIKNELCEDMRDAVMTIVPALLANGIHLPEPSTSGVASF